ncbi:unnamed protein product, partial [Symbiodinium pilosum]
AAGATASSSESALSRQDHSHQRRQRHRRHQHAVHSAGCGSYDRSLGSYYQYQDWTWHNSPWQVWPTWVAFPDGRWPQPEPAAAYAEQQPADTGGGQGQLDPLISESAELQSTEEVLVVPDP